MGKGYIIPFILIALLLVLAGFVVIGNPSGELQINEVKNTNSIPAQEEEKEVSGDDSSASSTDENTVEGDVEATTTAEVEIPEIACSVDSDCDEDQTCFIRPGGSTGYCY